MHGQNHIKSAINRFDDSEMIQNRNGNVKCGTKARQVPQTRGNVYVPIPATFTSYIKPKHTTRETF